MSDEEYVFDEVQIGKDLKPLAQHGFIVLTSDTITLLSSERQQIDHAPLATVTAKRIRFTHGKTVSLTMNDTKYNVSPGWGARHAIVLGGDTKNVKTAADALLHLIETPQRPRLIVSGPCRRRSARSRAVRSRWRGYQPGVPGHPGDARDAVVEQRHDKESVCSHAVRLAQT